MDEETRLTPEDVEAILRFVEKHDPVIVGGQSIGIWAEIFRGRSQELDALSPLTSKDIDFYHNLKAEKALEAALRNGELKIPSADNHTPEAAIVTGYLGNRKVRIDFMAHVLGVEEKSLRNNSITFTDPENQSASVTLMHPLDCLRSRLGNINRLGRTSAHSLAQARASVIILDCFIDGEISRGDNQSLRRAMQSLKAIEGIITDCHRGQTSQTQFGSLLDLQGIVERYLGDERLDMRFRNHQLSGILTRLTTRGPAA